MKRKVNEQMSIKQQLELMLSNHHEETVKALIAIETQCNNKKYLQGAYDYYMVNLDSFIDYAILNYPEMVSLTE